MKERHRQTEGEVRDDVLSSWSIESLLSMNCRQTRSDKLCPNDKKCKHEVSADTVLSFRKSIWSDSAKNPVLFRKCILLKLLLECLVSEGRPFLFLWH
jgi:hypothetical protein